MSNCPDDEGRDYVTEQADAEMSQTSEEGWTSYSILRCGCGRIVYTRIPVVCACGKRYLYWTDVQGSIKSLDHMDLGHLNNCVRMLASKAERATGPQLQAYENALDIFYAEIGSRDKEISQVTGILAAIQRSLK